MSAELSVSNLEQRLRQETLSARFEAQFVAARNLAELAAALPIQQQVGPTVPKVKYKQVDFVTEWNRWERDILAFEC
jgi:hypothetical protein